MSNDIAAHPMAEVAVFKPAGLVPGIGIRQDLKIRGTEIGGDPVAFFGGKIDAGFLFQVRPFDFNKATDFLNANFMDQYLDARLILVIAPAQHVIDPQDCLQIGQQIVPGHKVTDRFGNEGGSPLAATDHDFEACFTGVIFLNRQANIVYAYGGTVIGRTGDGNLEFARQEGKFRMETGPLPDHLCPDARVFIFIHGRTRIGVCGGVADAVARRLNGVHFNLRQILQDIGSILQLDPVELNILPGGEMAIVLVILTPDMGQHAHLFRIKGAIGNGNAQHIGVNL